MSEELDVTLNLTTEVCINCGVVFALPCVLRERLLESHKSFHCPNGHPQQFVGKTKDEEITDLEDANFTLEEETRKIEARLKYYKNKAKKKKSGNE